MFEADVIINVWELKKYDTQLIFILFYIYI